jgi:hypothetical protein
MTSDRVFMARSKMRESMSQKCLFQHLFRFVSPQDFYGRADIGVIQIHIQNENDVMDIIGQQAIFFFTFLQSLLRPLALGD